MVAVAMQENWQAVDEHIEFMKSLFARLISEGIEAGEFPSCDAAVIADLIGFGCCGAFHPAMIADCAEETSIEKVRGLARLMIRGLRLPDANVTQLPLQGATP
jgi:hypothetical protein